MSTEDDFRLTNLVSSYGVGTRSYNRSAERRELRRQRKAATEKYMTGPREEILVRLVCTCRSFQFPHELRMHNQLRNDWDWRTPEQRKPSQ